MIYHSTKIRSLTKIPGSEATVQEEEIRKFFTRFADLGIVTGETIVQDFSSAKTPVFVADHNEHEPWTRLLLIRRFGDVDRWLKITTHHGNVIIATAETAIRVYSPTELNVPDQPEPAIVDIYKARTFGELITGDRVRVTNTYRGAAGPDQLSFDFDGDPDVPNQALVNRAVMFDPLTDIEMLTLGPTVGYEIVTESGCYFAGNVHLSLDIRVERSR